MASVHGDAQSNDPAMRSCADSDRVMLDVGVSTETIEISEGTSDHQWSYMWVSASIGFHCMYWYWWWYVFWNVLVCIDTVCIMACIDMYYFWYVLHVLVSIGMYSRVLCTSIHMFWIVLACMEKWYVLYILVCICMYCYQLICIDLYWIYWYVLVCIVCTGLYL